MDDKELFEQLRSGPLPRTGFDEELRRRINSNLDNPRRGQKKAPFLRMGILGASFLILAVLAVGLWRWEGIRSGQEQRLSLPTESALSSGTNANDEVIDPVPHSAVVIGLRKDETDSLRSSYRTIVVAPEDNRLQVVGSGTGIWMPYGINFWQIEAIDDEFGNGGQRLIANKEGKSSGISAGRTKAEASTRTEKLLYAGDHYVSILETTQVNEKGVSRYKSRVHVNLLTTLTAKNRAANVEALELENIPLYKALSSNDPMANVDQWAVAREGNAWVAKQFVPSTDLIQVTDVRKWPNAQVHLEQTDVVKEPVLPIAWDDVLRLEPTAVDAFASPDQDVAIFVTPDRLQVVPYQLPEDEREAVSVDLQSGESVVMVQWAIQQKYVDNWKKMFGEWFSLPARQP
ncbi:hypothetical protein [Cohnella boryungensis]|uniref:Uncharacterized protein n=1 Tax=Cohnella boryungensis TaxID=768479 RepID=A0ABV8S6Z2_9BACL